MKNNQETISWKLYYSAHDIYTSRCVMNMVVNRTVYSIINDSAEVIHKMVRQRSTFVIFKKLLKQWLLQFQWKINNFEGLIDGGKMP